MAVTFDEPDLNISVSHTEHAFGIAGFLIEQGLVKTKRGANIILILTILVSFGASTLALALSYSPEPSNNPHEIITEYDNIHP
jgi:hypothetical protein